jgi:hypothetical protein
MAVHLEGLGSTVDTLVSVAVRSFRAEATADRRCSHRRQRRAAVSLRRVSFMKPSRSPVVGG